MSCRKSVLSFRSYIYRFESFCAKIREKMCMLQRITLLIIIINSYEYFMNVLVTLLLIYFNMFQSDRNIHYCVMHKY